MTHQTRSDILRAVEEKGITLIRLQFTDILGTTKNVTITTDQLDKALDNQIMFDGSSIQGFVRIQESDMYLHPDPNSFAILPWETKGGKVARLICDVYTPDGEPFMGCPRSVLKQQLEKAAALGYTMYVGPEPEFFLFKTDENGYPIVETNDKGGYFDLSPIDRGETAREEIVYALQQMGFKIEASHHEVAPGQHEIDFEYDDALTTADNISTFRYVTRMVAQTNGLHASFMPKPIFGENGSGMHLHQSLFTNGSNAFYDEDAHDGLSQIARHYIGGILAHAQSFAAITNPTVNSYKRLVPGYEAPVYVAWSGKNRSSLIRIPAATGMATRVELRCPDPSANPYLALATILAAGLDGIERKLDPGPQCSDNIFEMSVEDRLTAGIPSLPGSLEEAVQLLAKDSVITSCLGEHVFSNFVKAKGIEWDHYRTRVHTWELDEYLYLI